MKVTTSFMFARSGPMPGALARRKRSAAPMSRPSALAQQVERHGIEQWVAPVADRITQHQQVRLDIGDVRHAGAKNAAQQGVQEYGHNR